MYPWAPLPLLRFLNTPLRSLHYVEFTNQEKFLDETVHMPRPHFFPGFGSPPMLKPDRRLCRPRRGRGYSSPPIIANQARAAEVEYDVIASRRAYLGPRHWRVCPSVCLSVRSSRRQNASRRAAPVNFAALHGYVRPTTRRKCLQSRDWWRPNSFYLICYL